MEFTKYKLTISHNGTVLMFAFESYGAMWDFIESYMGTREKGGCVYISYKKETYTL